MANKDTGNVFKALEIVV